MQDGQTVSAGDELTEGSINPHELLKVKGVRGFNIPAAGGPVGLPDAGVDINDKHIEIIIRQMLKKVKVEDPGDTDLLPGGVIDNNLFEEINEAVKAEGGRPAGQAALVGITKASLATDSFLSAASFQKRPGCSPKPRLRANRISFWA